MPKQIQDKFTSMRISRQRKYQLRQEKKGLCRLCGQPGENGLCAKHRELSRIKTEKKKPARRRCRAGAPVAHDPILDLI